LTCTRAGHAVLISVVALLGCTESEPIAHGDGGTQGAVTYTKDVQPILLARCSPCHAGQSQGFHDLATTYADASKPVQSLDAMGCWNDAAMTMPKTVGECALISIMRGWMPMGLSCFNTPRPDGCVTLAEQAVIASWVAAGMPE
jgi:hypothetical protein